MLDESPFGVAELLRVESQRVGRTDMAELIGLFCNFSFLNAEKAVYIFLNTIIVCGRCFARSDFRDRLPV
jgi:hypothetical protein